MNEQATGLKKLMAQNRGQNSKFITIASGKGGVGKTNFAVNFAYVLANQFDKRVLLIDADIGMANVHLFLNADPKKNIKNLFFGERVEDVIQKSYGFDVLLGFSGIDELEELDEVSIQSIIFDLERISSGYDYVLIDTGAGVDEKVISFLRASHKAYIITTPEPTALMDAYALIRSIYNLYGYESFKVVVNMCKNKEEGSVTFNKLKMTVKKFLGIDIELLGYLPYTNNLRVSVKNKELITMKYPRDGYSQNIRKIGRAETQQSAKRDDKFWHRLFEFMGKS